MKIAVILFTYNRVDTLRTCLDSLNKSQGSRTLPLYIFNDGPRAAADQEAVSHVRQYLEAVKNSLQFSSVDIIYSVKNKGLARSVIDGVTSVLNGFDAVIVVEDDLIVSENYLSWMVKCLKRFRSSKKVHSISGFSFSNALFKDSDYFTVPRVSSWGWGTWSEVWEEVDWEVPVAKRDLITRRKFNRVERICLECFQH